MSIKIKSIQTHSGGNCKHMHVKAIANGEKIEFTNLYLHDPELLIPELQAADSPARLKILSWLYYKLLEGVVDYSQLVGVELEPKPRRYAATLILSAEVGF